MGSLKFNRSKKAFTLNQEFLSYLVLIVATTVILTFSQYLVSSSSSQYEEMAPNLTYQYPSVFVKSFLMIEIDDSDKTELNLDLNKDYYVYDLIYFGTDEAKEVVNTKRNEFIFEISGDSSSLSSLKTFLDFSDEYIDANDLLEIYYTQDNKPNLDLAIKNNNYVFYFKGEDQKYRHIYFKQG